MPVYDFDDQKLVGRRGESVLDDFFRQRGHTVLSATRGQQRVGIDRVFLRDGKMTLVEYKTDLVAHRTGKVFIETISVDTDGKPGWAYSSQADLLVYFIPHQRVIYVMPLEHLRQQLPRWCDAYPTRPAQNEEYATHGILVPMEEFEKHATQVLFLERER